MYGTQFRFAILKNVTNLVFPRLQNLSLYDPNAPDDKDDSLQLVINWAKSTLPALKRVQLVANESLGGLFRAMFVACHQLEHVYATSPIMTITGSRLTRALAHRYMDASVRKRTPLRTLTITLAPVPYSGDSPMLARAETKILPLLIELAQEETKNNVQVAVAPRQRAYTVEDAIADWLDVVMGGDGVWNVPEEPIATLF